MERPSISAVLITLNEEHALERVLESVRWVDEIVVLDSGSTDRTEEIARRYTDRFFVEEWRGFGPQKQRALELASGEWVLSLDADEEVSPELRRSIEHAICAPGQAVGFRVERHNLYFGEWFGRKGWRREWRMRLFRRDRARFRETSVHEGVDLQGESSRLAGPLLHYHYSDLEREVDKLNRYTSLGADQLLRAGRRGGVGIGVLRGGVAFAKRFILHGGFLYGRAGLMDAALNGISGFLKYAKLWEMQQPGAGRREEPSSAGGPAAVDAKAGERVARD